MEAQAMKGKGICEKRGKKSLKSKSKIQEGRMQLGARKMAAMHRERRIRSSAIQKRKKKTGVKWESLTVTGIKEEKPNSLTSWSNLGKRVRKEERAVAGAVSEEGFQVPVRAGN